MALLCGWHQIIGISREVEFSGCPGTRQCLGLRVTGIRVKVERRLVLFCSCAVQREVFSREGMGQGITGGCILLSWWLCKAFGHVFYQSIRVFHCCSPHDIVHVSVRHWRNGWLDGWSADYTRAIRRGVTVLPAWQDCVWCVDVVMGQ